MEKELEDAKLSDQYTRIEKLCLDFSNDTNCDEAHFAEAITLLNAITGLIKSRMIFSPNEDFSEIKAEHLKYLIVPYHLGDIYGRSMTERKEKVLKSNEYYTEFLKLMHHYGNLSKNQIEDLSDVKQGVNFAQKLNLSDARTQLIKRHQTKKTLEEEMKGTSEEPKIREYYAKLLKFYTIRAFEAISMNMKELEAIKYMESMPKKIVPPPSKREEEEKKIVVEQIPVPIPIPVQGIAQPRKLSAGIVVSANDIIDSRLNYHKDVFKPGYELPTMSLEEFGDFEKSKMMENSEKYDKMNEKEKQDKEADIDRDDISDQKTKKARDWDDWKDLHNKGEGNSLGKRI